MSLAISIEEDGRFRVDLAVTSLLAVPPSPGRWNCPGRGSGGTDARKILGSAQQDRWWDRATPESIVAIYETICAHARTGSDVGPVTERVRGEVLRRYGIDVRTPHADPGALRVALRERAQVEHELATLDLTDAAQAVSRACSNERAGNTELAQTLLEDSDRLYTTAGQHHECALRATRVAADLTPDRTETGAGLGIGATLSR